MHATLKNIEVNYKQQEKQCCRQQTAIETMWKTVQFNRNKCERLYIAKETNVEDCARQKKQIWKTVQFNPYKYGRLYTAIEKKW